jgi:hypothetical protein
VRFRVFRVSVVKPKLNLEPMPADQGEAEAQFAADAG